MKTTTDRPIYRDYIQSKAWRSRHSAFLQAAKHRCAALPWRRLGRVKHKYYAYNVHHTTYRNLGNERYGRDVLCVSPFIHDKIIHGFLSGGKRPSQQQHYPNAAQSMFHLWCRLPASLKLSAIALGFFTLGYAVAGLLGGIAAAIVVFAVLHF